MATPKFVDKSHIGQYVITAGWIDLDLEPSPPSVNKVESRKLPPGLRLLLRGIEGEYAYLYRNGVIKVPTVLLEPWEH